MDIEFLDCDYEWVDLDALAAEEAEAARAASSGEAEYLDWFITSPAMPRVQANA